MCAYSYQIELDLTYKFHISTYYFNALYINRAKWIDQELARLTIHLICKTKHNGRIVHATAACRKSVMSPHLHGTNYRISYALPWDPVYSVNRGAITASQ